jgi:hypothetical protein
MGTVLMRDTAIRGGFMTTPREHKAGGDTLTRIDFFN